jgi:hypothetical protein
VFLYCGDNTYLRVFCGRIVGTPIVCADLSEVLRLPLGDQIWLGVEAIPLANREPIDGAIVLERDGGIIYESAYCLENGDLWAIVSLKIATHIEVIYPEQGEMVRALLTQQEYVNLTRPACPHCVGEITNVIHCGDRVLAKTGVVSRWQCQKCKRRFVG